jgi:tetratricopeptide (TPR) repeat protein
LTRPTTRRKTAEVHLFSLNFATKASGILMLLIELLLARGAAAQMETEGAIAAGDPPGYREAILLAVEEYAAHNYPEALEQFRRAHELQPSARTLRGLGVSEFELRNYRASAAALERALASNVKLLARVRTYLGTLSLNVVPEISSVIVDGEQRELDADHRLVIDVGNHVLEFNAPGRASTQRTVRIGGGRVQYLSVALPPAVASVEHEDAQALETERETSRPHIFKRWWFWTVVGAAVVSAGVVSAVLLTRPTTVQDEGTFTANRPPGPPLSFAIGR